MARFSRGYLAFGGRYLQEFLEVIIACESGWDPLAVSPGGHLGLAQFEEQTWAGAARRTGLWDWTNPEHQGANAAVVSNDRGLAPWSCAP